MGNGNTGSTPQTWAVLDTETGGFTQPGSICEVGVVWYDYEGNQTDERELRAALLPGLKISPEAERIHGISQSDLAGAPTLANVMAALAPDLHGIRIVAQSAWFDKGQLDLAAKLDPGIWRPAPEQWAELSCLAFLGRPGLSSYALDYMLAELGFSDKDFARPRHSGLGDAQREGAVLRAIVSEHGGFSDFRAAFRLHDEYMRSLRERGEGQRASYG